MVKGAIIYSRVSTQGQSDEGTSLETQIAGVIKFAEAQDVPVLKVYREVYTGAELYDRPLLSEARREMKSGNYSHLIAYSIDRLSRDPIHLAIIAMECERANVELSFVTEPLDSTPEGALIRYVRGYAAQVEREKIRERCIRGKRAIATSGRVHRAGTDLYGYRRDREAGKRTVNEAEARVVRRIFEQVMRGASVRAVVRYLNAERIPAPSVGKRIFKDARSPLWGKSAVTRILREPSYKGQAIAWRWKSVRVGGRQRIIQRPVEEQIPLPEGTAPEIVSPGIWDAAQKAIKTNGGAVTRNAARRYLLRGFVFCLECGERCYSEVSRGTRFYRCSSRQKRGGACGARAARADFCELGIWEQLAGLIGHPEQIRLGLRSAQDDSEQVKLKADLKAAERELARSEAGLQKLIRRFRLTNNPVLIRAIEMDAGSAHAEHTRLRARIAEIESRIQGERQLQTEMNSFQGYCRRVRARLPNFEFEDKQLALRAFKAAVRASGRGYQLTVDLSAVIGAFGAGATEKGPQPQYVVAETSLLYTFPRRKAA